MARQYAKGLPIGDNGQQIVGTVPASKAVRQYTSENGTASSVISFTHDTTAIEVATTGTAAVIAWVTTADSQASVVAVAGATANYDHMIPANTYRRFVIPIEAINNAQAYGSAVGANRANGLYQRIAWKTQGIASVFMTEYGSANSY